MLLWKELFEGANGDPISSRWTAIATGTGAATNIQSNQCAFNIGSVAGGVCSILLKDVAPADFDLRMDFKLMVSSDIGYGSDLRFSDTNNLYFFEGNKSSNTYALYRKIAGVQTKISSDTSLTLASGDTVHFRIVVNGSHWRMKHWLNTATEPTTWNIDLLDNSLYCGLVLQPYAYDNGLSTGDVMHVDSVSLSDFKAPPTVREKTYYYRN